MKFSNPLILVALLMISNGCYNYTKDQSNSCMIHNEKMAKAVLPIHYGLIRDFSYINKCPNGRLYIAGGCLVRAAKFGIAYTCRTCRRTCKE